MLEGIRKLIHFNIYSSGFTDGSIMNFSYDNVMDLYERKYIINY